MKENEIFSSDVAALSDETASALLDSMGALLASDVDLDDRAAVERVLADDHERRVPEQFRRDQKTFVRYAAICAASAKGVIAEIASKGGGCPEVDGGLVMPPRNEV